jgi:integrase
LDIATLELVRAILRKCVDEWEWLERAPKIRMLKEPVRRIRFLRQEEAQRLIAALPEHLAAMASFSLSTGLRAANVTGLQWTQVDLIRRVAWIHPDQAKARRAIPGAAQYGRGTTAAATLGEASRVCVQLSRDMESVNRRQFLTTRDSE